MTKVTVRHGFDIFYDQNHIHVNVVSTHSMTKSYRCGLDTFYDKNHMNVISTHTMIKSYERGMNLFYDQNQTEVVLTHVMELSPHILRYTEMVLTLYDNT